MAKASLFARCHYVEVAALLAQLEITDTPASVKGAFAVMFKRDNPAFDWEQFMKAAKLKGRGTLAETLGPCENVGSTT